MSKRNVTNDRNTLDKKAGTTRKSASSAKPTRAAAGSVYVVKNKKTKQEKKEEERRKQEEDRRVEAAMRDRLAKDDSKPESTSNERIKKLRIIWGITLAGAVICTILAWFARNFMPDWASIAVMVLAYVFIIAALFVDLGPIRKERKRAEERVAQMSSGEQKKVYREVQRQVRAEMREEDRAERAKAKEREANGETDEKPSGLAGLFGGKK